MVMEPNGGFCKVFFFFFVSGLNRLVAKWLFFLIVTGSKNL